MIQTVDFYTFLNSFSKTYENNFSEEGKKALFDYLEQLEDDLGEKIELDPVSLCCDYSEFSNLAELKANYPNINSMDKLESQTTVIKIPNTEGFIIQDF